MTSDCGVSLCLILLVLTLLALKRSSNRERGVASSTHESAILLVHPARHESLHDDDDAIMIGGDE